MCRSIERFKGETIVNAANEEGMQGGGVDGAITMAGGIPLFEVCPAPAPNPQPPHLNPASQHRQALPILRMDQPPGGRIKFIKIFQGTAAFTPSKPSS